MSEKVSDLQPINSEDEDTREENTIPGNGGNNVANFDKNRARRTRAYRKLEKKQVRTRNIAGVMLLILLVGSVLTISSIKRVSNENKQLTNELSQANLRIESISGEMQSLKLDNDMLVQGRIPGLTSLKFDAPFKLENQTLKSVVFTQTKHNGKARYEYLAVVHNTTQDVLRPASLMIFFNNLGVEVGKGRIAISTSFDDKVEMVALQPGESHSFTGTIEMISTDEPRYFKLIDQ